MEDQKRKNKQAVLIDADAFVALVKQDDANHGKAKQLFEALKQKRYTFYTTDFVFAEAVTVISQRIGHDIAIQFIDRVLSPTAYVQILDGWSVKRKAIELFKKQSSKNVSMVDCMNMAFVEEYGFGCIFSFDKVYKQNGYTRAEDFI